MRKVDECGMEKIGTLDSSEKTIAIVAYRWWPQTPKQEGDKTCKRFVCNIWKRRNECPNVGRVSIRSRNGAPSLKGCVFNCQMTKASKKSTPPPLIHLGIRRCHLYARKSASQAVLRRIQLTLRATRRAPHGASRVVQAMSAWSVKLRRAPSCHCRDARVYGHTTTVMHDMSTSPLHLGWTPRRPDSTISDHWAERSLVGKYGKRESCARTR